MKDLQLGVAREIITPEVGGQLYGYSPDLFSTELADDLTATAFYFRQGDMTALMVSLTVCEINTEISDRIREMIEKEVGVPKENCILAAIHTHSGPNTAGGEGWGSIDTEYCESIFVPRILSAAKKAAENIQSVVVGVGCEESYVAVNRRELKPDNKIRLGQNPSGPFDPKMTVISFKNDKGEIVANIVHYGCHCTAAGVNKEISRDWAGVMIDRLEAESGGITAFFNGTEGDTGPRLTNGRTVGTLKHAYELGGVAAQDAVRIFKTICDFHTVELKASTVELKMPLKKRLDLETATELYKKYEGETVNYDGMMRIKMGEVIASYENGYEEREYDTTSQTVIGIGNTYFAAMPYEVFSEIGMRIDRQFNDARVLTLTNGNGRGRYFITEDALCRGGYEVDMWTYQNIQPYVDNADWHLISQTVEHIKALKEG